MKLIISRDKYGLSVGLKTRLFTFSITKYCVWLSTRKHDIILNPQFGKLYLTINRW